MTSLRVTAAQADIGAGIIIALFSAWAFYVTLGFDPPALKGFPGAAFFPQLILVLLILLSMALLVRGMIRSARGTPAATTKDQADDKNTFELDVLPFLISLGGVIALLIVMEAAGLEIAAALYIGILLWVGTRRPLWSLIMAVVGTAVLYLVFVHVLNVHLPLLILPRYF